jgi:hypothetical protein
MRGDEHWTAVNEIEHQAWELFRKEFDAWEASLPPDSEIHDMEYLERLDLFFARAA